ncbi:3-hydroxybutyryl-CoA dehydrogenase [Rhodococcus sp. 14C212]|uniref:3-hydroxyacyl-CoA dehydrogenase family protein n=1 Tax=Rhodococcus sp. 14C212 TaxID=2711209 RepID=UPI0013EB49D1|nr:3-hydroxyacyl-CoA dehydrogenase NAD-binding domain-containing protein [Rhodococcus sp. 14C212]NGP07782.1 3-hydroxybutyryl-CoA dehydrogenase [Rhodococcus sp. 14C212]
MSESTKDFRAVAILGFGTRGARIAQVFAASGREVIVLDTDRTTVDAGTAAVAAALDASITAGQATAEDKTAILDRITGTTSVADFSAAEIVVEAVTENAEVKKTALAEAAAVVDDRTPIVTTTDSVSVTDLAAALPNSSRVAGLHFFNPAPTHTTVEVVRALQTGEDLIERLVALVDDLGKVAVVVPDRPGFLVNSMLLPYLNDVIQEFDDGLATAEDIDVALELGLGYKTGPFAMLDRIGLDVHLQNTEAVYTATSDARYAPPPLLRQMVAAGRLGDKSDHGFRTAQTQESN